MHPVLRNILLDLRVLSSSRKVQYLNIIREALRIHGALTASYRGKSVTLDAEQVERFLARAA